MQRCVCRMPNMHMWSAYVCAQDSAVLVCPPRIRSMKSYTASGAGYTQAAIWTVQDIARGLSTSASSRTYLPAAGAGLVSTATPAATEAAAVEPALRDQAVPVPSTPPSTTSGFPKTEAAVAPAPAGHQGLPPSDVAQRQSAAAGQDLHAQGASLSTVTSTLPAVPAEAAVN